MSHPKIASSPWRRRTLTAAVAVGSLAVVSMSPAFAAPATDSSRQLAPNAQFALHRPDAGAIRQVGELLKHHDTAGAVAIANELLTPQADWFTKGTPDEVRKQVKELVRRDNRLGTVPTLVVYYVPGRDCSQYSSGGAPTDAAYRAWIDGFVAGLGDGKAVIIVEPDGLANLPKDCPGAYPGQDITALTESRYADIAYAGHSLEMGDPNASVYLDAGNGAWQNVGEIATRLSKAGVSDVQGISLNVSNYQLTTNTDFYGTWVSECLAYGTVVNPGAFSDCPNQYWNGGPSNNWTGVAMDRYGVWSDTATNDQVHYTGAITERYASMLGSVTPTAHFVVDTGRNGRGQNDMTAYAAAPYNQPASVIAGLQAGNWCNGPGAALGQRPTVNTGAPLADAYLWVKTVGESDGQCNVAGGARAWDYTAYNPWGWTTQQQQQNDPIWGMADPAAGAWFPAEALQLAQNAAH